MKTQCVCGAFIEAPTRERPRRVCGRCGAVHEVKAKAARGTLSRAASDLRNKGKGSPELSRAGGLSRSSKLTDEERKDISKRAVAARWSTKGGEAK